MTAGRPATKNIQQNISITLQSGRGGGTKEVK